MRTSHFWRTAPRKTDVKREFVLVHLDEWKHGNADALPHDQARRHARGSTVQTIETHQKPSP